MKSTTPVIARYDLYELRFLTQTWLLTNEYNKAFDEIDGHGFGRFARNFDEIDRAGFGGRFVWRIQCAILL